MIEQLATEAVEWLGTRQPISGAPPEVEGLPIGLSGLVETAFGLLREPDAGADDIGLHVGAVAHSLDKDEGAPRAAALLYQIALEYFPGKPGLANRLGRVLRTLAMFDEAEAWLTYAADTARRAGTAADHEEETLALSCLGRVKRDRGNFPAATRYHEKSLAAARRYGLRKLEGDALYALAVMAFERNDIAGGIVHARAAVAAYGPGHTQLVRLANDLAWLWMHQYGDGARALELFSAIEPHVYDPPFRAVLLANIARALATVDVDQHYEAAWLGAYCYICSSGNPRGKAAALGQLALAAILAQQIDRAREVAGQCREVAAERGEHRMVFLAEQVLAATIKGMPSREDFEALFPGYLSGPDAPPADRAVHREFTLDLGDAVGARADAGPESPMRTLVGGNW